MQIKEFDAKLSDLKPTDNNPRQISKEDLGKLKKSLKEFPEMKQLREVVVDENMRILGGHQRVKALKEIGEKTVPVKQVTGLSEAKKREFVIKDNVANGDWDMEELLENWSDCKLDDWGINLKKWEESTEYQKFVEKFEPKLTTDDCYTPPKVFEAVEQWVRKNYDINHLETIRPFKPEGDYQKEDYTNKVVIDNPPFSIMSDIIRWYNERKIKYFLFGPHLTLLASCSGINVARIFCGVNVTYENGAVVLTSFMTNLEKPDVVLRVAYDLYEAICAAQPKEGKDLQKYDRPRNCKISTDFQVSIKAHKNRIFTKADAQIVKQLDGLKEIGKGLYGSGMLISDQAANLLAADKLAADKLAADKLAADKKVIKVGLSEREQEIVKRLTRSSKL